MENKNFKYILLLEKIKTAFTKKRISERFRKGFKACLIFTLKFYQQFFSLFVGGGCRFFPSCSCYAEECLRHLPLGKATYLIVSRVLSCHPLSKRPYLDPVFKVTER